MEKSIHKLKAEFAHLCVRASKLLQSFLRHIRNVDLLFKKDFESAKLLTKTSFFFYFRDRP